MAFKSGRDVLPAHAAANMFPLMSETDPAGFNKLVEDIRENAVCLRNAGRVLLTDGGRREQH